MLAAATALLQERIQYRDLAFGPQGQA